MSVAAFLSELRRREIRVWVDEGGLRCDALPGVLSGELVEQLRSRKAEIVEFLSEATALASRERGLVPLQAHGTRPPVFAVPGHNGDVFCYRALAAALDAEQPFFGLQPPGVDGQEVPLERVEALAAYFAAQIGSWLPRGRPCLIAGFCAGGTIAFELAQRLSRQGVEVRLLALFGCPHPSFFRLPAQLRWRFRKRITSWTQHLRALAASGWTERARYVGARLRRPRETAPDDPIIAMRRSVERATVRAARRYRPQPYAGRMAAFLPSADWADSVFAPLRWPSSSAIETYDGPGGCDADGMLRAPHVAATASLFRRCRDALIS